MINIGSLARIDHLALIAASILRINSSRAVIKHQMPVPTLLPEHFTAHLGWAGAGTREGEPSAPEDANRQSGNPSASSLIPENHQHPRGSASMKNNRFSITASSAGIKF